jgi:hypothetical protein
MGTKFLIMATICKNLDMRFIDFILRYPDKNWAWYEISSNPNITMEDIDSHPDKPWNWEGISMNPNITMEDIDSHPDKPWDWGSGGISGNKFGWKPPLKQPMIKAAR